MNLIDQLDLLSRPNDYGGNTSYVFYLRPMLPSSAQGRRKRVGNQGQPARVAVQFAPAASITLRRDEEIDRSLEFMGPVFSG